MQYENNPANAGNRTYHLPLIKVNNGLKSHRLKIRAKFIAPKNAHLHALWDVFVQYENNPANTFQDIVGTLNLSSVLIKVNNSLKVKG